MSALRTDWKTLEVGNRRWPIASFDNDDNEYGSSKFYERRARLVFENGWLLSVVWGTGTYSSNHDFGWRTDDFIEEPITVELAAWNERLRAEMTTWPGGDSVEGYVPVETLPDIIDMIASLPSDAVAFPDSAEQPMNPKGDD